MEMLKIVARLEGERWWLSRELNKLGIKAVLGGGSTFVELPESKKASQTGEFAFFIPSKVKKIYKRCYISATEEGKENGSSQIVCGLSGKALKPYYMPRDFKDARAHFCAPYTIATVIHDKKGSFSIFEHKAEIKDQTAKIVSRLIWRGIIKNLPVSLVRYQKALEAAQEKSRCNRCQCTHYAAA